MRPSGDRRLGRCGAKANPEQRLQALRALVDGLGSANGWLMRCELDPESGPEVVIVTDPALRENEGAQCVWLRHRDLPDLPPARRQVVQRLGRLLAKRELFSDLLVTVDRLIEALADTDRWAGQNEQKHGRRFYERLDGLLEETSRELNRGDRDRLRACACSVLSTRKEERDERNNERKLTLDGKAERAAIFAATEREIHMRRISKTLRAGQPVSNEDLDQAIATYTELRGAP